MTDKITNFKLNKSGVAGIQHFQAKEYSNTLGLRGGGSRYKFTNEFKNFKNIITNFIITFQDNINPFKQGKYCLTVMVFRAGVL